jgi:DNA-binding GntR family transcriptional regulator
MQRVADRANLSDELAATVRDMILDGSLPAGERVNEVHLAARLGVSRTPVREALSRLVSEGAVTIVPRLGFFICPLTAEEVEDIYPMRALLDPAALRLAGIPPRAKLERLKTLNRRFAAVTKPAEAVRLDDVWHLALIEACPNIVLLDLIQQFMWRTRRYELGLMRHRVAVGGAAACQDRIIAALEAGDLDEACRELEGNMSRGRIPVLAWLADREKQGSA